MVPRGLALLFVLMGVAPAAAQPRLDALGDPLPPGAVARLGTLRLRHPGDALTVRVVFSPDGKLLASLAMPHGESPSVLRLWDAATGQPRGILRARGLTWRGPVVFAPD